MLSYMILLLCNKFSTGPANVSKIAYVKIVARPFLLKNWGIINRRTHRIVLLEADKVKNIPTNVDTESEVITDNFKNVLKNEKTKLDTSKASSNIQQIKIRFTSFWLFFFDFILIQLLDYWESFEFLNLHPRNTQLIVRNFILLLSLWSKTFV